jgi:hypothetical protein
MIRRLPRAKIGRQRQRRQQLAQPQTIGTAHRTSIREALAGHAGDARSLVLRSGPFDQVAAARRLILID